MAESLAFQPLTAKWYLMHEGCKVPFSCWCNVKDENMLKQQQWTGGMASCCVLGTLVHMMAAPRLCENPASTPKMSQWTYLDCQNSIKRSWYFNSIQFKILYLSPRVNLKGMRSSIKAWGAASTFKDRSPHFTHHRALYQWTSQTTKPIQHLFREGSKVIK